MKNQPKLSNNEKSNLPVKSPKRALILPLKKQVIVGIVAVMTLAVASISDARLAKMAGEITKIIAENNFPVCEQYVLTTVRKGKYPCHECENGEIYLKRGEVWRYGFAGIGGQSARYPSGVFYKEGKWLLNVNHLEYKIQLKGTKQECEIEEKIKIYSYPMLPEAQEREINLIRPPGNKQDR